MIKIYKYGEVDKSEIFARDNIASGVETTVAEIIARVAREGDAALKYYTEKFDKVALDSLEVTEAEIDEAFASVDAEFVEIIRRRQRTSAPSTPAR